MLDVADTGVARNKIPLRRRKKWVIAVDPFKIESLASWLTSSLAVAENAGAEVYLVYVLGPAGFNWTGDFSSPWLNRYKPPAEERLIKLAAPTGARRVVLTCRDAGVRALTRCLLRFTQKIKADAIVLSTHAEPRVERWQMGSFAETLTLSANAPILVFNPAHPLPRRVRRILVPTDLGPSSVRAVLSVGAYARVFDAEIVLYHQPHDPAAPLLQNGVFVGEWMSFARFIDFELEAKARQLEELERKLRRRGVVVSHVLDTSEDALVSSIESAAEIHSADLVAVTTHAGPPSESVLGSVARGLVRTSPVPVMLLR